MRAVELPDELIDEILVRLPVKSLMRFKSVSKKWLSMITNHRFAFRHHSLSKHQNLASFLLSSIINFITPLTVRLNGSFAIESSINLPLSENNRRKSGQPVLVSTGFGIYCVFTEFNRAIHLWNPSTTECISFLPPQFYGSLYFAKVDFADGVFSYKVGIVKTTEEDLGGLGVRHTLTVKLYSSKTKSWKVMPHFYNADINRRDDGACVNLYGKAHWFTFGTVWEEEEVDFITTFDYENEVLGFIPIRLAPEVGEYDHITNNILSLWNDEFLCLVLCWDKDDSLFIDIWVMREYGVNDSWSKEFTVGPFSYDTEVLGFSSKLHGIFLRKSSSCPTSLMLYDYKSSRVKEFSLPNEYNCKNLFLDIKIKEHVESVISVVM